MEIIVTSLLYLAEVSLDMGLYPAEVAVVVMLVLSHTTALTTVHQKTGVLEQERTPITQALEHTLKLRKSMIHRHHPVFSEGRYSCNILSHIDTPLAAGFPSIEEVVVGK